MQKDIKRESEENKNSLLIIDENKKELYVNKTLFLQENGIDGIIRIPEGDFEYIKTKNYYAHFNLNVSNHMPGSVYALPKIIRFGYFDPDTGEEQFPLLSFEDELKFECIRVEEKLSYNQIDPSYFEYTLDYLKNQDDVKNHILGRYKKSMKGYCDDDLLKLGVSITLLKKI